LSTEGLLFSLALDEGPRTKQGKITGLMREHPELALQVGAIINGTYHGILQRGRA
jgi:hypothetical protein